MRRKVIQLAGSTLVVSLPMKWVKKHKVVKGCEVDVEPRQNRIIISAQNNNRLNSVSLDINNLDSSFFWYHVIAAYRNGFDEILIIHNKTVFDVRTDKEIPFSSLLLESQERLIGFQAIKNSENMSVLREFSHPKLEEFDSAFRKLFLSLVLMADNCLDALNNGDENALKQIALHSEDNQINRLADFCIRVLNKLGSDSYASVNLISLLEQIGDGYVRLCKNTEKPSAEDVKAVELLNVMLRFFYNNFFTLNKKHFRQVNEHKKSFRELLGNCSLKDSLENISKRLMEAIISSLHQESSSSSESWSSFKSSSSVRE